MPGKSKKPKYRGNVFGMMYTQDLQARVVAETGIPTDRFHIGKLLLRSLKDDPDFVGQIDGALDKSETNRSMLERSIKCAIAMKKQGLKKGDVLVLMAPNYIDLVIPVYAAMYLGVAVAGTDMTLGVRELEHGFKVNKPSIVFCEAKKAEDVAKALEGSNKKGHIVTFDEGDKFESLKTFLAKADVDEKQINEFKATDFDSNETISFLTATSGTTGLPKSAVISHENMAITLPTTVYRFFDFPTPTRLYFFISPPQWLSATVQYLGSVIYKYTRLQTSGPLDRNHMYDVINKYRPTAFMASPTFLSSLLAEEHRDRCDFTSLEIILLGGSFVSRNIFDIVKEISPDTQMQIGYGMSELSGIGFFWEPHYPKDCIGRTCGHHRYRLVDPSTYEDIEEPNVAGELWVKGPAIFKGYYNNPEATKETFSDDGWLRTGDLFTRDEQCNYFYVDRIKTLLKYMNHQISPIELEAVIRKHPKVLDVIVVGVPDPTRGDLPAAFVIPRAVQQVTAQEIKDIVKETLTDFKQLRGGVIFIEEFPMTVSTKVDRAKLKKMAAEMKRE